MRIDKLAIGLGKAVAVSAILIWSLFPIAFIIMSAFKPGQDIFAVPPKFVFTPTWQHYAKLWADWGMFFDGLFNSAIITIGATILAITTSTSAGYAYSRYSSRFLNASVLFLIIVRLIPPIVVTLPLFPIINAIGLNDTHIVLIVLYATFFVSLGTVLMRTFIDQIPRELDEAAQIDGASRMTMLRTDHRAARRARNSRGCRFRRGVRVERVPVRLHLHGHERKDRAACDLGDDRIDRWRRLGRAVRRVDHSTDPSSAVRRSDEPIPRGRSHGRRDKRLVQ